MNKELETFLQEEFGITREELENMTQDELSDFFDEVADVEIDEAYKIKNDGPISKRGRLACDLEDYINDYLFK